MAEGVGDDRRIEVELVARDFATVVFEKFAAAAIREAKKSEAAFQGLDKETKKLEQEFSTLIHGSLGNIGKVVQGQAAQATVALAGVGTAAQTAGVQAAGALAETGAAAVASGGAAAAAGAQASGAFGFIGEAAVKAAAKIGVLVGGIFTISKAVQAVRTGARAFLDFNDSLTQAQTILRSTSLSFEEIEERLLAVSLRLGENEALITRGFYEALSSGITDAAEAMNVLTVSAEAATAGFTETLTIVDVTTSVLNAYGRGADEARAISDVLFKTIEFGKGTMDELATEIGDILPFSAQLGVSFEEISAAIAVLTKTGAPTSEAVTRVRSAMIALFQKAEQIDELFRTRLGRSFSASSVAANGFVRTLEDIILVTGGDETALKKLFGRVEGLGATLSLTANNGRLFKEALQGITDSAGATADALEVRLLSPAKQFEVLTGGIRQGLLELGRSLITTFTGEAVDSMGSAQRAAEALKESIAGLAPEAGAAANALTFIGATAGQVLGVVTLILRGLGQLTGDLTEEQRLENLELRRSVLHWTAIAREAEGSAKAAEYFRGKAAEAGAQIEEMAASMEKLSPRNLIGRLEELEAIFDRVSGRSFFNEASTRGVLTDFAIIVRQAEKLRAILPEDLVTNIAVKLGFDNEDIEAFKDQIERATEVGGVKLDLDSSEFREGVKAAEPFILQLQAINDLLQQSSEIGFGNIDFTESARKQLVALAEEAAKTGRKFDVLAAREFAVKIGLDPDKFIRDTGLFEEDIKARFERLRDDVNSSFQELGKSGLEFDPEALNFENLGGALAPDLSAVRAQFSDTFKELAAEAKAAGVDISHEIIDPLIDQLLAPGARDAFREMLAEVGGEGLDLQFKIDQESIDKIQRELDDLKIAQSILKIKAEVEKGDLDLIKDELSEPVSLKVDSSELELLRLEATQAALEFEKLFAEQSINAEQLADATRAIGDQLSDLVAKTDRGKEAFASFLGPTLLGFSSLAALVVRSKGALDALDKEAERASKELVNSEQRIIAIQSQALFGYEGQRQAIIAQAESWRKTAEERLAAVNPAALERETAEIYKVRDALLARLEVETRSAIAQVELSTMGLRVTSGRISSIEAEKAAILEQTEALRQQAELLGYTPTQLEAITAAGKEAADAVGTFGKGFKDAASNAANLESIGAQTFNTLQGLAVDFGAALANGGDSFKELREVAVKALLDIIAKLLIAKALGGSFFGGGGGSGGPGTGGVGGGGGAFAEGAQGGIVEGARVGARVVPQRTAQAFTKHSEPIYAPVGRSFDRGGIWGAQGGEPSGGMLYAALGGLGRSGGLRARSFDAGGILDSVRSFAGGAGSGRNVRVAHKPILSGLDVRSFQFGGVAQSPTVAIFAERPGTTEAFVPLGPSRRIPVEIKENGPAGGGVQGGGGGATTINLRVESLDPRRAAEVVMQAMPMIQAELASAIASGRAGQMVSAVRQVSGRN